MQWFNINQLAFYNPIKGVECYCEQLVYASDLTLQAILTGGAPAYTVTLYTYSADGLTQYEDSTSSFDIYTAKDTQNRDYFNARLNQFTSLMCSNKCFLIRAVVTSGGITIFDKFTERYCVSSCCDIARGVTYEQDGITITIGDGLPSNPEPVVSACGSPLIRIISRFDCIDNFTGNFFGDPVVLYSGTGGWNYTLVTSCRGRIVRRPRDIKREISYNCRLQRTESAPTYLLETYEYFPAWKMYEIEGQLHANHIWVDDYLTNPIPEYIFNGGTPFKKVDGANSCTEVFKLFTTLNGCIQRQIYGCNDNCESTSTGFLIIPAAYQEGNFYDENGLLIAGALTSVGTSPYVVGLIQWLASQDGITNVEEIDITGFECEPYTYAIIQIDGNGLIPASIYFDAPVPANQLFTVIANTTSDLCSYIGEIPCAKPVAADPVVTELGCATPVNDLVIVTEVTTETLTITDYGDWVQNTSSASLYQNVVTLSLDTTNTSVAIATGEEYTVGGAIIGSVSVEGRPTQTVLIEGGTLPADTQVTIDTTGAIRYYGIITITTDNEIDIVITNIFYNI